VVTGGLAKNVGVVKGLELALKTQIVQLKEDPQIVGALGAAVFASQKAENNALPGERN
jgi:activator of 2-hydroxyglutaryl-CoA dehydratase